MFSDALELYTWSAEGMMRAYLLGALWYLSAIVFVADTLGWYQLMTALWGGVVGLWEHGIGRGRNVSLWDACARDPNPIGCSTTTVVPTRLTCRVGASCTGGSPSG